MDDLIFDRLSSDVDMALNNPNSSSNLKGAYNYTDLNRVESWCEYLQELLKTYGFGEELDIKTDWTISDYPTRTEIDRIRQNVDTLKSFCISINPGTILYNNTLNYEQANLLEKILYQIYILLTEMKMKLSQPYNFGVAIIIKDYVYLEVNNIIAVNNILNQNYNIGATLIRKDNINLNAVSISTEVDTTETQYNIGSTIVQKEETNIIIDNTTRFTPSYTDDVLLNPGKGFVLSTREYSTDTSYDNVISVIYYRFNWCAIEPEEGEYDWDLIDEKIEDAKERRKKICFWCYVFKYLKQNYNIYNSRMGIR